jgi:hypothetical protein
MATTLAGRSQPRFHGPGALPEAAASCVDTSHRDRSRRELCPNPIGSDTSCRCSVRRAGWRRLPRGDSGRGRSDATSSPSSTAVAMGPCRAASRDPPRRGARSAAPEVPSVDGCSLARELPVIHNLSPVCGVLARRLFDLRTAPAVDDGLQSGATTRPGRVRPASRAGHT